MVSIVTEAQLRSSIKKVSPLILISSGRLGSTADWVQRTKELKQIKYFRSYWVGQSGLLLSERNCEEDQPVSQPASQVSQIIERKEAEISRDNSKLYLGSR